MSGKKYTVFLFVLLMTLLVVACSTSETTEPTTAPIEPTQAAEATQAPAPTQAPEPAERKVATFIWTQEWDNLNPLYTGMWFSAITTAIWNTAAWHFDVDNNPVPVLAVEIPDSANGGISEDGRTITVKLRQDAVWSDGTPITAADFVFTYEMVTNPSNVVNSTYPYELLESVTAPDPYTVVATFTEPFVPWLATLWGFVLPQHVLQPVFEADGTLDNAEWNLAPTVSGGPYLFAEWESGSYARFVRNDNYYGTPAKIDEIFFRFVPDDAAQTAALTTGDGDLGTFIPLSDVPGLKEVGVNVVAVVSGYDEGWYIYFGEEAHPALADVRVRQAIALCFDRFSINENLLLGISKPAATFWDNTPFANPDVEPWPYDPAAGMALLDAAGWIDSDGDGIRDKDGEKLELVHGTTTRQIRADVQAVAQQQLAECGIQLEIIGFSSDVFFQSYGGGGPMPTGQLDIAQWSASEAFPDPDSSRWLCGEIPNDEFPDGNNDQKLCDEELDGLFQKQSTQLDFAERQATLHEIGRIMHDNVYWLGVWQDLDTWAVSNRLSNVTISGATPFYSIEEWDIP